MQMVRRLHQRWQLLQGEQRGKVGALRPTDAYQSGIRRRRERKIPSKATAVPTRAKLPGSGTLLSGVTFVCDEKLVTVVDPSRFTSTVNANPSVVSVVSAGIAPATSENMLNANVLPEVETPSGALRAGP